MSVPPSTNQVFRVVGDLEVQGESVYKESRGVITFRDSFGAVLTTFRAYGFAGFYKMLFDSSPGYGIEFRTNVSQGDPTIGGSSAQYPLVIDTNSGCKMYKLTLTEEGNSYNQGQFYAGPLFQITKPNTNLSTNLRNSIGDMTQQSWKGGEKVQTTLGMNSYSGFVYYGFHANSSSSSDTLNYGYLGTQRNGTPLDSILLRMNGNVEIPLQLTATTISATTYLNLPPVPASELLPLTLDKTNNLVGINNTTPTAALDVVGDIISSGTITGTLATAAQPNITSVGTLASLDVTGDIDCGGNVSGTLSTAAQPNITSVGTLASLDVTGDIDCGGDISGTLSTASQPNITSLGTLTSLNVTGNVNIDSNTLVVDSVNNRVGINKAVPAFALDVVGTTNISSTISCQSNITALGIISTSATFTGSIANGAKIVLQNATTKNIGVSSGQVNFCQPSGGSWVFYKGGTNNDGTEIFRIASTTGTLTIGGQCYVQAVNGGIAIGSNTTAGGYSVALGNNAAKNGPSGSVAVGDAAAEFTQGDNATAVGRRAGQYNQAAYSIAIGSQAGDAGTGEHSIAIGTLSGTNAGANSISIGREAGVGCTGGDGISIGRGAANVYPSQPKTDFVCIGLNAGKGGTTGPGDSSISIGSYAGFSRSDNNCIVINANLSDVPTDGPYRCYVKPIRGFTDPALKPLYYNTTTGEITHG